MICNYRIEKSSLSDKVILSFFLEVLNYSSDWAQLFKASLLPCTQIIQLLEKYLIATSSGRCHGTIPQEKKMTLTNTASWISKFLGHTSTTSVLGK